MDEVINELLKPSKLWSREEVLIKHYPVPRKQGIYAWYFKEIPPQVPTNGCHTWQGLTLLYLGISPLSRVTSRRNLAKRIRTHNRGNAYGSTLRKSLGCLLSDKLGIRLQQVGKSGKRIHFADGEEILSEWMAENAFVTWVVREMPWEIEELLIGKLNLPLNLRENETHPFYPTLSAIRKKHSKAARERF